MNWTIINNRIAYSDESHCIFPSAWDIFVLNKGDHPTNPELDGASAPSEELKIRFSKLSAIIRVIFDFDNISREIILNLVAVRGKNEQALEYKDYDLPDSILINEVWHSLQSSNELVSSALHKAQIQKDGVILLNQYASLKKILRDTGYTDVIDNAEEILSNHPMKEITSVNPVELKANLYPYQQHGFQWMRFIADENCGCILGDEMGLGKTLQIITLVAERKQAGKGPTLVVAPVSLLENWRREFEKFTEGIKVFIHHGAQRTGLYTDLSPYNVVVVSYNTAVSDMSMLKMIPWDMLVIDEAQNIKNPSAIRTRAVKELPRTVAIAVTGTPFENHLTDIWSIMDFILPGYLGRLSEFLQEYPDDILGAEKLEPYISPFMIRRRVADVAQDLPERIDIPQVLTLSSAAASRYEDIREQLVEEYGEKKATLPTLQKLRMYCTHPALLEKRGIADPIKDSEKYERLCELMEEIVALGEKVILFTTYNGMFDILSDDIPKRFGIRVLAINGATPPEDRQQIIDRFSDIQGTALLVLNPRAAGAGLNITAASRVIHYNLEWNPALEDQASARAYRRGQDKKVFIYRLYYKDTVEEIINERIEKKRDMFGAAVVGVDGETVNSEDIMRALMISPGGKGI